MNCPNEEILLDYTAGRLDGARTALLERHAESCMDCASLIAAQSAIWRSLDEWKPAPVSPGFNRELWRLIDEDTAKSSWTRELGQALGLNFWKQLAPLAVALALVVTAFMFDHSGRKPNISPATGAAPMVVSAGDADQLDQALDDLELLHEVDAASPPVKPESGVM